MADSTYNGVRDGSKAYNALSDIWRKMRDVIEGEEAVHRAATKYLPKLSGQTDAEYSAYRDRAPFYTATARTLDGLTGVLFARPIKVEIPDASQELADDVTLQGDPMQTFAEGIAREVMSVGSCGVLVDMPSTTGPAPTTQAQEQALNLRPFARVYCAESILGTKLGQVNNVTRLVQVRLLEIVDEPGKDEFSVVEVEQVRVLELLLAPAAAERPNELSWQYQQRVFRKNAKGDWVIHSLEVPMRAGVPLDFIPFQPFGPRDIGPRLCKPPLLDVANMNVHHYRTNADYHHGLHFTGLPTPIFSGFEVEKGKSIVLGAATAIVSSNPEAKAAFLEFTGQGLSEPREELKRIEQQLASLGARMLAPEKLGVEAADALEIRNRGEQSVMMAMGTSLSLGLTNVLNWMLYWAGDANPDAKVELNRDFLPRGITAQTITALLSAYNAGTLLLADVIRFMQRADVADPNAEVEAYIADLQTQKPKGMDMGGGFDAQGKPLPKPGAKAAEPPAA